MYFNSYPLYKSWFRQHLKQLGAARQQLCAAWLIIANYSDQLTSSSALSQAVSNTSHHHEDRDGFKSVGEVSTFRSGVVGW
jgi:hemoglobin-like flavoprotein